MREPRVWRDKVRLAVLVLWANRRYQRWQCRDDVAFRLLVYGQTAVPLFIACCRGAIDLAADQLSA